jgi:hypothetical protein
MSDEHDFLIGRSYDLEADKLGQDVFYDPDDLTTHGVVVGMTGSGKTGLCVDILEEAALQGIPALIIDPKGDIANLLLHFPDLAPADFKHWVDPDEARREGISIDELAEREAAKWKKGLEKWDIDPGRMKRLQQAAEYAVYTPGSDAGIPVSILASLKAPGLAWDENRELVREKVSSTATALLGLVGIEADPVRSREHILLANLFEASWKAGQDMDLMELIRQIQSPPMERLGAFELDRFYPEHDRFELAMLLNNLLASPTFEAWVEGVPLDIENLLWAGDKPRHSVFYLAHLPESERMFFVTLLMAAVESWMRGGSGSSTLRALIYFDEVLGYLPPVAVPPSKPPMLRLLKQARAFGVGLLLTTQNPVDLDYKALSNAGTWFIGKLQTEQDKARLLDGLESSDSGAALKRDDIDRLISQLSSRVFILHNVHEKAPTVFRTRWAMAYLRGPISREQIHGLNDLVNARTAAAAGASTPGGKNARKSADSALSATRPAVPQGTAEYFLPNNLTSSDALSAAGRTMETAQVEGLIYRPTLLAQAAVRYLDRKHGIYQLVGTAAIVDEADRSGVVRWEDWISPALEPADLDRPPAPDALYADLFSPFNEPAQLRPLEADFKDYIYHSQGLKLFSNAELELLAEPGTTEAGFRQQLSDAAQAARDEEVEALKDKYESKIDRVQDRLTKEERELAEDETELSARKMEELATHAENILSLFGGSRSRRRVTSSLTKRRMTGRAKADVEESQQVIEDLQEELVEIEAELKTEVEQINDRWAAIASEVEETAITPYKKDIRVEFFGIAWKPYWRIRAEDESFDVPAFKAQ